MCRFASYRFAGDQILNANQFSKKDKVIIEGEKKDREKRRNNRKDKDVGAPFM
jgi:hypothetical protein